MCRDEFASSADLDDVQRQWLESMRRGDFEAAWRQTDRIELPRRMAERSRGFKWQPHHLVWNGRSFADQRVVVRCNHGLGDTLQFFRFIPQIARMARSVTALVQPALVRFLTAATSAAKILDGWDSGAPPEHDLEIEIMELAYALRLTPAELPATFPYFAPARIQASCRPLPAILPESRTRVGLAWAASEWDPTRSLTLAELEPLTRVKSVGFLRLQQGETISSRDAPFPIQDLTDYTTDILEAAAAILRLDLVITVDSMLAHLAGALARPVWVILRPEPDWRWMREGTLTPWYPTMRLFRRRGPDWSGVIEEVAEALEQFEPERSSRS